MRTYRTGYLMKANAGVYNVIRQAVTSVSELVTQEDGGSPAELIRDLDFVIAGKVTAPMISSAARLKMIVAPGIGTDGIDLDEAGRRNIAVACTVAGNINEVAEHALMLMLAVSRRLTEVDAALRRGEWLMWDRRLQSYNLAGRRLGVVGFGRIGKAVAHRAAAFGMQICYYDPIRATGWEYSDLDALLASSDIVVLSLPLTEATNKLMTHQHLFAMKRGSMLINVARGEVVDEPALIEALQAGHLAGAGLDVFAEEPPPVSNPLLSMPNVVLTPHVGSGTLDGLQVKAAQYAENIRRFLAGEPLIDCVVPPRVGVGNR
jgi:D-3-phosphoglycerate dehydrogenase